MAEDSPWRNPVVWLGLFLATVFMVGCVGFAWRDHRATERCHDLGGVTWDSGQHCTIGVDRVIDTHNRTFG